MIEEFHRVKRLPPYVFAEVNRLKAAARARGADIIDLGMGNPDMPTPQHIVDKLVETVAKPRTNRYSASKGIPGLRKAQAAYYARRFGVKLNPETQVVATLGSKEGFANMAQAITAPGDVILVPSPTYPIHEFGFIISGAAIRHIPTGIGEAKPDPRTRHGVPARRRAGGEALDPQAAGDGAELSVQPDGDDGRASISTWRPCSSRRSST